MGYARFVALLLLAVASGSHAFTIPGSHSSAPETDRVHEQAVDVHRQGTVTNVDPATSTVFVDGTPYLYAGFGTVVHGEVDTGGAARTASTELARGMRIGFTARKERSFNKARIIELWHLGPVQRGK